MLRVSGSSSPGHLADSPNVVENALGDVSSNQSLILCQCRKTHQHICIIHETGLQVADRIIKPLSIRHATKESLIKILNVLLASQGNTKFGHKLGAVDETLCNNICSCSNAQRVNPKHDALQVWRAIKHAV